jgi:lipopolysaccharide biosynthesis protein
MAATERNNGGTMHAAPPRLLTYYLPQFHPIHENDEWWGKGFTEWTNTAKAKPRFPGHYQPHVPSDLGFYDLRLEESRIAQAELARAYGIEGFCYYHYWFGNGRRLLERPFEEVLASGKPDFPFCLCWANDTWSGVWHGTPDRILIKQEYPGLVDDERHFETLLPAFRDHRYIRVNDNPVLLVWRPFGFPNPRETLDRWRSMAKQAGLPGLHFIGVFRPGGPDPESVGFDASVYNNNPPLRSWGTWKNPLELIVSRCMRKLGVPTVYSYKEAIAHTIPDTLPKTRYPSVVHAWDNSPRSGVNGLVFHRSSPELFRTALRKAFELTRTQSDTGDGRLIFLKSWNEWAEGNHLEPDIRDGHGYLEAVRDELQNELKRHCSP